MIKAYIMGVFHDFHTSSKFEKSLNATFIAIILNKSGATDLGLLIVFRVEFTRLLLKF